MFEPLVVGGKVEAYKKNMYALLGKPGYEDHRALLESRMKD